MSEPIPQRVLIVDERGKELTQLTDLVTAMQFSVSTVSTSVDAMRAIQKNPPDILITDLLAPKINGWDLAEKMAADYPEMVVIVMTSRIWQSAEQILTDLSVDGYLLKPLNPRRVETLLRALSTSSQKDCLEVVLADGDQQLLDQARRWLESRGYAVHVFTSLTRAEAEIKASPPDLVVVDRKVGPFDGLTMVRDVRQTPWTDHLPIILTGQNLSRDDILRAAKMKVNTILSKPYGEEDLILRVEKLTLLVPGD